MRGHRFRGYRRLGIITGPSVYTSGLAASMTSGEARVVWSVVRRIYTRASTQTVV